MRSTAKARAEAPETFRDLGRVNSSVPDHESSFPRGLAAEARQRVDSDSGGLSPGDHRVDVNVYIRRDSSRKMETGGGRQKLEPWCEVVLHRGNDACATVRVFARRLPDVPRQESLVDEARERGLGGQLAVPVG